jgi:hypothetical protein
MMSNMAIYQPTPLEQVYSLYLAQQTFGVVAVPNNPIHISGRNAVPFLTQTGLDRGILRSVWTVADPENIGTLTHLSQFHLLLRMVSMAQAGILNPQLPLDAMKQSVHQFASQLLPLATFTSVVIPPQDQLMAIYGSYIVVNNNINSMSTTPPVQTMPVGDAFAEMVGVPDAPLGGLDNFDAAPPLPIPAASAFGDPSISQGSAYGFPHQTSIGSTNSFGAGVSTGSVSDAFTDMGPPANASLPSLEAPTTLISDTNIQQPSLTTTTSFSDTNINSMSLGTPGPPVPVSYAFSDMVGTQDAPLPGLAQEVPVVQPSVPSTDDGDDDFGDFGGPAPAAPVSGDLTGMTSTQDATLPGLNQQVPVQSTATVPSGEDVDFGDFEDVSSTPAPVGDAFGAPMMDDFGMTAGAPAHVGAGDAFGVPAVTTDNFGMAVAAAPLPISDAFGSLLEVADAPLPSLDPAVNMVPPQEQTEEEDDDDFGGFETAAASTPVVSSENPSTVPDPAQGISSAIERMAGEGQHGIVGNAQVTDDDEFGDFGSHEAPASQVPDGIGSLMEPQLLVQQGESILPSIDMMGRTASITEAFGELEVQDAPLPTLDQFAAYRVSDTEPAARNNDDDDDFGDFEGTAENNQTSPKFGGGGNMNAGGVVDQSSGSFAVIPEPANQPLSHMETTGQGSYDEDFGGFQDVASANNTGDLVSAIDITSIPAIPPSLSFGQPTTSSEGVRDISALGIAGVEGGAIVTDENDPFSAFDSISGPPQAVVPPLSTTMSTDEASPADLQQNVNLNVPEEVGDFEGVPSGDAQGDLGVATSDSKAEPGSAGELLGVSGLGGFVAQTQSLVDDKPSAASDDPFSAFDSIAPTPDVPLPHLPSSSPTKDTETRGFGDADDDFGAFDEARSDPQGQQVAPNANVDAFGAPPVQQLGSTNQEDEFGDFGGPPNSQEANADFGAFEAVSGSHSGSLLDAAPAQPLGSASQEDDFGDFGGPPKSQDANADFEAVSASHSGSLLDAAPAQLLGSASQEDDFGGFGGPPNSQEANADFGAFEAVSGSNSGSLLDSAPAQPLGSVSHQEDNFGDFGGQTNSQEDNADFGAFEGVSGSNPGSLLDAAHVQPLDSASQEDEFGDFGEATKSGDVNGYLGAFDAVSASTSGGPDFALAQPLGSLNQEGDADFGDFGGAPPQNSINNNISTLTAEVDFFGGFDEVPAGGQVDGIAEVQENNEFRAFEESTSKEGAVSTPTDEFGGFGGAATDQPQNVSTAEDDFGDFGSAAQDITKAPVTASATQGSKDDDFDDFGDFGSFEQAPNAPSPVVVALPEQKTADDDWGDFENVAVPAAPVESFGDFSVDSNAQSMRDQIRSLSMQLPESLLRKAGLSGDHVDLAECFEVNIGMDTPLDSKKKKRVERCIQVFQCLSKGHSKLGSAYWEQVFKVVKDDLVVGSSVILDAKKLSSNELAQVEKPFQTMIAGFAEYMRVTRSIVATIGDVLMLDASALLTIDTWASTWCSLELLETALQIEKHWKEMQREVKNILPSIAGAMDSVSLGDIRTKSSGRSPSNKLCQLTLQPLAKDDTNTTRAEVSWQGKDFMACSANFLAHRCPFYVVGG